MGIMMGGNASGENPNLNYKLKTQRREGYLPKVSTLHA